jgi:hypothetical protein
MARRFADKRPAAVVARGPGARGLRHQRQPLGCHRRRQQPPRVRPPVPLRRARHADPRRPPDGRAPHLIKGSPSGGPGPSRALPSASSASRNPYGSIEGRPRRGRRRGCLSLGRRLRRSPSKRALEAGRGARSSSGVEWGRFLMVRSGYCNPDLHARCREPVRMLRAPVFRRSVAASSTRGSRRRGRAHVHVFAYCPCLHIFPCSSAAFAWATVRAGGTRIALAVINVDKHAISCCLRKSSRKVRADGKHAPCGCRKRRGTRETAAQAHR